jgi:hypothetical protein
VAPASPPIPERPLPWAPDGRRDAGMTSEEMS